MGAGNRCTILTGAAAPFVHVLTKSLFEHGKVKEIEVVKTILLSDI